MKREGMIPIEEVADVLRKAARGEVPVTLTNPQWAWGFSGDVSFQIDGWTIVFFNDVEELDYCDSCIAPDGRTGDFDEWYDASGGQDPVALLMPHELNEMQRLVETAK